MTDARPLDIGKILPLVRKPGQYVGGELHAVDGRIAAEQLSWCLLFPDLYEIGMSHQGLQILYHILNRDPRFVAHRAYAPDVDMEAEMRSAGLPMFSLEGKLPLATYDVLGITLPYELCYTNILTALDLAGIPKRAVERSTYVDQLHIRKVPREFAFVPTGLVRLKDFPTLPAVVAISDAVSAQSA